MNIEDHQKILSECHARHDAEVAELKAKLSLFEYAAAEYDIKFDQLREQVVVQKKAIDALVKFGTTVAPSSSFWEEGWVQHEEALAATEPTSGAA